MRCAGSPAISTRPSRARTTGVCRRHRPKDPVLSPIYSDLHGLPPTLFITSGRDLLLSGTVNLHRAYLNAGVDARLVVFDALTHAFWYDPMLPEAQEANHMMADFL
jgi:epsilon-lactone hydrolase